MDWRRELMGGLSSGIDINNYLTIEALEDGLTAKLSVNACQYCVDGSGEWKTLAAGTATESINSGQTLSFRGELQPERVNGIGTFTITKKCNLLGDCMSMLFGNKAANNYSLSGKDYAFYKLFNGCTKIINCGNILKATTLSQYCYSNMFYGCSYLVTPPELPAMTLDDNCYEYMFRGCSSLTTGPELPATTLAWDCYCYMFSGCTSLTTAPELPATTLVGDCYCYMFQSCSKLTTAPELPATKLGDNCYYGMFKGCMSLIVPPKLPATTLSYRCYGDMFNGCINLTTAPELPATTLANYCYYEMFYGCTALTTAPELLASVLKEFCYFCMFYGCKKLNYIKMLATDISASVCLSQWAYNTASTGRLVKSPNINSLPLTTDNIPYGWISVNDGENGPININDYLTIEALEDGLTASLSSDIIYEYCVDGDGNWKTLTANVPTEVINTGQTLSFRGNLVPIRSKGIGKFTISKKCNLKGDCTSLLYSVDAFNIYDLTSYTKYAFYQLFYNCETIINCGNILKSTTLADYCYAYMFCNCKNLITAPELPATTLVTHCYDGMFLGTSLTVAPTLPATTLVNACYNQMFQNCTKLNYIKMLATDISASLCLNYWVSGVAANGTFVKHPDMTTLPTATSSNSYTGIPEGWTVVNDGEESGGSKIVNKVQLVEKGADWVLMFDYPINSDLQVNFADGSVNIIKGNQQYSTGYPIFDKPTIVGIDPLEDDKYIYTW